MNARAERPKPRGKRRKLPKAVQIAVMGCASFTMGALGGSICWVVIYAVEKLLEMLT